MRRTITVTQEQAMRDCRGLSPDEYLRKRFHDEGVTISGLNDPRLKFESLDLSGGGVADSLAYRITYDDHDDGEAVVV